jgi:reactive intermediate/imine deaminase
MSADAHVVPGAPPPAGPYSHFARAGGLVFTSGVVPVDPATGMVPDGAGEQTRLALRNLGVVLAAAGVGFGDVVKTTVHLADLADFAEFNQAYQEFFTQPYPVRTTVGSALAGVLVEIDAVAALPQG